MMSADLTDTQYEIADAVELWLETHPGYHSPSKIARGVKTDTGTAHEVLRWMLANVYVAVTGNGAWQNYGSR